MALAEAGGSLESLPSDLGAAIEDCRSRIPASNALRCFGLGKSEFLSWRRKVNERLLDDNIFQAKVAMEYAVGVFTKVMAIIAGVVFVNFSVPTVFIQPALALDADSPPKLFHNRPDNAFQLALTGAMVKYPPGYRFVPNDMELMNYLTMKINNDPIPVPEVIRDANVYGCDPQKLIEETFPEGGEREKGCYFFTPRDRKYPNGSRPNRKAGNGYWKATGRSKEEMKLSEIEEH